MTCIQTKLKKCYTVDNFSQHPAILPQRHPRSPDGGFRESGGGQRVQDGKSGKSLDRNSLSVGDGGRQLRGNVPQHGL